MSKVGVAIANVDHGGGRVTAELDTLSTALHALADDSCQAGRVRGGAPRSRSERRFLRCAICRLSHLFPYLPKQPGYNKRMRALVPLIVALLNEALMRELGAISLRPDRTDEQPRFGALGGLRKWVESIWTRSRASSRPSATAPTPCPASPASRSACSRSPPVSGTTGTSATQGATWRHLTAYDH